jgi:hypothetical protein
MIATVSGWACIACLVLVGILEPNAPKKDGRFKTGYKDNAKMPVKSEETKQAQKFFLIIGAIAGAIWYFAK